MQLPGLVKDKKVEDNFQPAGANSSGRVRSFIKIQDGCNDACAYCIVPRVRGGEQSLPPEEIINEVKAKVAAGYKEIVFTGTKIGDYNHKGVNLRKLIERVLAITNLERLHVSSLQPQDISQDLLELWQDSRLCQHFHLALQSGSSGVLRRMRRRYSLVDYTGAISRIRKVMPDAAITTDIIVGFPAETPEEFDEGYRFCKETEFAAIHVFTYSARPGTPAARMPAQVGDKLKKERSLKMLQLAKESADKFNKRFLGKSLTVLWEKEIKPGSDVYSGLSHNYIRTFARSDKPLDNRLGVVAATRLDRAGLWVEVMRDYKN